MKTCKKCGIEKATDEFPSEKRNKDGLSGTCRVCTRAKSAEWERNNKGRKKTYYENNRERLLADKALYYQKNSELIKAKVASHRTTNADKIKEYFQGYSAKNSAKIVERVRNWRLKKPGRKIAHNQNRRARKLMNGGKLSPDIVKRLLGLQKGKCAACRCNLSDSGHHLDHVIPLSLGGQNSDSNTQLLCPSCNTQKHTSHPVDFMRRKGFLL